MFYKIKRWFLTIFGDIKYYKYPMFIIYCPETYKVKGQQFLEVQDIIRPGDIVLRGYDDYLDGLFIPGDYSHSGVYIGDNKVVHAVAEGVVEINLCDFMRTDRIIILRPHDGASEAVMKAELIRDQHLEYDFNFSDNNNRYYCHEFSVECYKKYNIEKKLVSKFWGLYKKYIYLAESLINNHNFDVLYEYNPKSGINYVNMSYVNGGK